MSKAHFSWLALAMTFSIGAVFVAAARGTAPAQPSWSGWARCQISVSGQGYTDQQTHTWMLNGGTPTVTGAFRVYPATWSVVGGGSLQRTQGNQTLTAQWATTAENLSAPLAVFVRASDGRMFIQARHAQVRSPRSVNGYQQLTIDGKPQFPGNIAAEAFEWSFPVVEVSRPKPGANATANGSSTPLVNGKVGIMQPAGTQATASCNWQFGEGTATPAAPPTVAAQSIPTPSAVSTTPPPGQAAAGAATCVGAPRGLTASVANANVTLSWLAPTSGVPASYVVQAGSQSGGANLANFSTGNPALSFSASNVRSGSYFIRVYASSSCGMSGPSNEVLVTVP